MQQPYVSIQKLAKVMHLSTVVENAVDTFKDVDVANTLPLIQSEMKGVVKQLTARRFVNPLEEQAKLKLLSNQLNKFLLKVEHTETANKAENHQAFDALLDVATELKVVL